MLKTPADDGAIARANTPETYGERFVRELEAKAKGIYPDHSTSRDAYIREKVAEELTRLNAEFSEAKFRLDGLDK